VADYDKPNVHDIPTRSAEKTGSLATRLSRSLKIIVYAVVKVREARELSPLLRFEPHAIVCAPSD